jgi:hypothetical protein
VGSSVDDMIGVAATSTHQNRVSPTTKFDTSFEAFYQRNHNQAFNCFG